ncbi:uncharacterized protein LOC144942670 [Lampetra fluviatilis]
MMIPMMVAIIILAAVAMKMPTSISNSSAYPQQTARGSPRGQPCGQRGMSRASPNASLAPPDDDEDPPQLLSYHPALGLGQAALLVQGLTVALYVVGCALDAALVTAISCLPALRRKPMFCFMASLALADLLRAHAGLSLLLFARPGLPGAVAVPLSLSACRAQLFFFSFTSSAGFASVTSMLLDSSSSDVAFDSALTGVMSTAFLLLSTFTYAKVTRQPPPPPPPRRAPT